MTNLTGSLAFVVFGVGLDDTFIIMGQWNRTDPRKDPIDRVCETMEVVGLSIFVTTLTTMMAFCLGTISAVPAIRWLCLYALPTICIDFVYQVTFFVALLVMDEQRIQANRRDCLFCITVSKKKDTPTTNNNHCAPTEEEGKDSEELAYEEVEQEQESIIPHIAIQPKNYAERFMERYADILLLPQVKVVVILCFTIFLGFAMYSASLMEQEFKAEEIVPKDSYVKGFLQSVNAYSAQIITVGVYFRDVNQSDPKVQEEMRSYVEELKSMELFDNSSICWVTDFPDIQERNSELLATLGNLTYSQQLDLALSFPAIKELYGNDIVRDSRNGINGNITASRCWLFIKNLDMQDVQDQTDFLLDQREITLAQPVNEDRSRLAFFSFDVWYIIWVS